MLLLYKTSRLFTTVGSFAVFGKDPYTLIHWIHKQWSLTSLRENTTWGKDSLHRSTITYLMYVTPRVKQKFLFLEIKCLRFNRPQFVLSLISQFSNKFLSHFDHLRDIILTHLYMRARISTSAFCIRAWFVLQTDNNLRAAVLSTIKNVVKSSPFSKRDEV